MTQGRFDGLAVERYAGRVRGTFDVDNTEGEEHHYGELVVGVIVARVGPATIDEDKNGDIRRINAYLPEAVRFLEDGDFRGDLLARLGVPQQQSIAMRPVQDWASHDELASTNGSTPNSTGVEVENIPADLDDPEPEPERTMRVASSPSTVGASQQERDPVLARFLEE